MAFSDLQVRRLKAKLDPRRVRSRTHDGREITYVEGWYVVAEANRIFGFDGWDRLGLSHQLLYERPDGGLVTAAYHARVRVIVRAGSHTIVREGSGFGSASKADAGEAHELAFKAAETDATKRALSTFGNRFGLSLYERDSQLPRDAADDGAAAVAGRSGRPKRRQETNAAATHPASSRPIESEGHVKEVSDVHAEYDPRDFQTALIFLKATRERLGRAASIDQLDEILARAQEELAGIKQRHPDLRNRRGFHLVDVVHSIAELRRQEFERRSSSPNAERRFGPLRVAIDKSRLALAVIKRHRNRDHLKRVSAMPCLVCGRIPSHAHHLRFAQDRGLSLKVSDEFVVPLCAIDHDALHRAGDERAWWRARNIDPLPHAARLWAATCASDGHPALVPEPTARGSAE